MQRFARSTTGAMLAAAMLGLRDVLEPERDEVAIVVDAPGAPPNRDPYVLRLDPEHPEDSIVMVRPWLRGSPRTGGA